MSSEGKPSPTPRSVVLGCVALTVAFSSVALWAISSAEADPLTFTAVIAPPMVVPAKTGEPEGSPEVSTGGSRQTEVVEIRSQGRDGAPILNLRFYDRDRDAEVALRDLVVPRTVTVVNLWATWCEPCKAEFKDFKRLWGKWGGEVRFIPVELSSLKGERDQEKWSTRDALHGMMPAAEHHLVDISERRIQDAVVGQKLADADEVGAPITLVFDCKRRLVWQSFKQIEDVEGFAAVIDGLRPTLTTGACYEPPAPRPELAAPEPVADGPRCGDGICTTTSKEDCWTCPADCGCVGGKQCIERVASSLQPGSTPHVCDSPSPLLKGR